MCGDVSAQIVTVLEARPLPCPVCGATPKELFTLLWGGERLTAFQNQCSKHCPANLSTTPLRQRADALALWNAQVMSVDEGIQSAAPAVWDGEAYIGGNRGSEECD